MTAGCRAIQRRAYGVRCAGILLVFVSLTTFEPRQGADLSATGTIGEDRSAAVGSRSAQFNALGSCDWGAIHRSRDPAASGTSTTGASTAGPGASAANPAGVRTTRANTTTNARAPGDRPTSGEARPTSAETHITRFIGLTQTITGAGIATSQRQGKHEQGHPGAVDENMSATSLLNGSLLDAGGRQIDRTIGAFVAWIHFESLTTLKSAGNYWHRRKLTVG